MLVLRRKVKVTINLELEVAKKAKELGLNVSKICENALKEYIRRLTDSNLEKKNENDSVRGINCLVDEEGFEPSTSAMPTPRSFQTDLLAPFFSGN